jgi:hypothetical protein
MTECLCEADVLARLERTHRQLAARAGRETGGSPGAVLNLGLAVVLHGVVERIWLLDRQPLLEPAVRAALAEEHDRLLEDLELLDSIMSADGDSPDLRTLSQALLQRLQQHVARDDRLLYRPEIGSQDQPSPPGAPEAPPWHP